MGAAHMMLVEVDTCRILKWSAFLSLSSIAIVGLAGAEPPLSACGLREDRIL